MVTETRRRDESVYRDTGCDLHRAGCLSCPLPACKYDEPGGGRTVRANDKAGEIIRLRHAGFTIEEIAERTGRSRRTVFRLLQRAT